MPFAELAVVGVICAARVDVGVADSAARGVVVVAVVEVVELDIGVETRVLLNTLLEQGMGESLEGGMRAAPGAKCFALVGVTEVSWAARADPFEGPAGDVPVPPPP